MTATTPVVLRRAVGRAERSRGRASWALAARLARREVRRRKGRTALVVALVAIPVIAMTIASVAYRTTRDTSADVFSRSYGEADLVIHGIDGALATPAAPAVRDALPAGSREVVTHELYGAITPVGGKPTYVRFTDLPLADAMAKGIVDVTDGRVPTAPNEVLLSPGVARTLGVDVGDALRLEVPAATYDVVGIGRSAFSHDESLVVVGAFDFSRVRPGAHDTLVMVDLPGDLSASSIGLAGPDGPGDVVAAREDVWSNSRTSAESDVVWGWVAGALALTVMGIIIAAAFATSARRQLVTLGQLASNGADRKVLRRTLALQGAWSGVIGAVLGIAIGLALILPQHGLLERIVNHSLGGMAVASLDLMIIGITGVFAASVAAFVPSRSITRVPVLSALGGRRPLGAVPRWLVPLGGTLFAGGLALIALAAAAQSGDGADGDRNLFAFVAVLGGLGVLFGMCCATPAIVAVLGPIGERLTGTARLSARSLARVRVRSAAIVTAIAAAGALSIGGGTAISTRWDTDDSYWSTVPYLADEMVGVQAYSAIDPSLADPNDPPLPIMPPVPADVLAALQEVLPDAIEVPVRAGVADLKPEPLPGVHPEPVSVEEPWRMSTFVIADPALVDAMGLSATDREALAAGVVLSGFEDNPGSMEAVPHTLPTEAGPIVLRVGTGTHWPRFRSAAEYPLISPERAEQVGLTIASPGALFINPEPLTGVQRRAIDDVHERFASDQWSPFRPASEPSDVVINISAGDSGEDDVPKALIDAFIVAGALLFILAVVAVGLALSAAESRDERDVLLAVGAPPRAMRRVSAQKAVLLTAIGGVLAVPTGFLPVAVVLAQVYDDPIRFPWLVVLGCVAVIPLLVGAAALAGSAVAQRSRPVHMSTLATD